ncbi:ABC transporter ATP-binding protein OS=Stutzerimonas stutzeri OX=316 GN=CXK95_05775 PE=4 SV=1 [Stutzerimonas stutzeri]
MLLAARGLRKEFGGFVAVNNVDLDVRHARVHALIGPNGAGKTTVFNLLTKFLQPTAGSIHLLDQDITRTDPGQGGAHGAGALVPDFGGVPHLSVLDNVRVALQRPNGLATQVSLPLRSLNQLDDRAMRLLESGGAGRPWHEPAADLSYGRKRVLELATTLALEPRVLLLDEPLAGIGHEDVHTVAEIIRQVATERAVLMVERNNLKVVADLCHQVTVLQRGEILTSGDYRSVSQDERVRVAYMGTEDD